MDIDSRVKQWLRPEVQALHAYQVPDASGLIKLDAMENPYRWPQAITEQWLQVLREVALNRYPDPQAQTLKQRLRQELALAPQMDILLGNGSDEIIQILMQAVARPGACVLAPEPSFVMYRMTAIATGLGYHGVPLQATDFALDRDAMLQAIAQQQPALIFLAYPNNPTGNLFAADDVTAILEASEGLVVLDEAYHVFAQQSFAPLLERYDNLLVMRTLSKMGLAGLRLGYLLGARPWLQQFDKLRLPYNINSLTQASANFILSQGDFLQQQSREIRDQRATLEAGLASVPGVQLWPSAANFILFRVAPERAEAVFQGLLAQGILVKNLHPAGGVLSGCLRVTVGTAQENQAFLQALAQVPA